MRYVGAVSWLFATVVLFLAAGPAAGQLGDNVLVQGSPYGALASVYFDDSDRLHVAREYSILIIDPETGNLADELDWIELCTFKHTCAFPEDLVIGPDGSLYWAGPFAAHSDEERDHYGVGRRSPEGVTTLQLVAPGLNTITFSDDGRLFAACGPSGDGLYELDPELVEPPRLLVEGLGGLGGIDFGPDGFLYGSIWPEDRVVRIDVAADPPTVETVLDGRRVSAVNFDSRGRLVATDYGSGEVLRTDVGTGTVEVIAQLAEGLSDLAFDSTDRLYVSSFIDGSIVEVLAGGDVRTVVPGGLVAAQGVAVLPGAEGDRVFVSDRWSVREIDGQSGQQIGLTSAWFAPDGLRYPVSTVAPHDDALVVTSGGDVQVLDPEQGVILEQYTDFDYPVDAISFDGDVVVVDWGGSYGLDDHARVVRVGDGGAETLMDSPQDQFLPRYLAATGEDLWVAGRFTTGTQMSAILQLIAGREVQAIPIPVRTGLEWIGGFAVDALGRLLVVENDYPTSRLSRVDPQTGAASVLVELNPESWNFGVAVGSSGSVYVTDSSLPAVYRFDLDTFYVPAAGHLAGVAGTQWVTDLTIHNRADTSASFSIDLLPKGRDNNAPESVSFSLEPSSSIGYDDALDVLFNFSGAAALRVRTTRGDLVVGSRTYNAQPEGTYGQSVAGFPEAEALVSGDQGLLIGLAHSPGYHDGYRTNIGFANASGATIRISVRLFAADGAQLRPGTAWSVELAPYSYDQLNNIFRDFATTDVEHGFAVVESSSPGARYFAYASVIDNRTGDATYIPAR